jgi:hypothetical protein
MSRPRALRFRRYCVALRRKPASGRCPTRRRVAISRTLALRRSGSIDQSPNCHKRSLASTPRRISIPRWPRSEKRLRSSGIIRSMPILVGEATAPSPPKKAKGGTGRRPSLGSVGFPPRATISIRRSGTTPSPQRSRDKFHPCIIPITSPVRPHMVMRRAIPMPGRHQDLGSFGKGGPSPACPTPR